MLAHTDRRPITLEDQNATEGESSHENILLKVKERMQTGYRNERNFTEAVRLLKRERIEADYSGRIFTDVESIDCKAQAESLIAKLKTYFGNL